MPSYCAKCEVELIEGNEFCHECGHRVAPIRHAEHSRFAVIIIAYGVVHLLVAFIQFMTGFDFLRRFDWPLIYSTSRVGLFSIGFGILIDMVYQITHRRTSGNRPSGSA